MRLHHILAFILISLISCSDNQNNQTNVNNNKSKELAIIESKKILDESPLIELRIMDLETRENRTLKITDKAKLAFIKAWILELTWPPLDGSSIGAVIPRGHLTIFDSVDSNSKSFVIPIYGSKSRADPEDLHISNGDWRRLITQLEK